MRERPIIFSGPRKAQESSSIGWRDDMSKGRMDVPLKTKACPECHDLTYEEEFYGCDCQEESECESCGIFYADGPHPDCYSHWGLIPDEDIRVELFAQLLEERDSLLAEKEERARADALLVAQKREAYKALGETIEKLTILLEDKDHPSKSLKEVVSETEVTY